MNKRTILSPRICVTTFLLLQFIFGNIPYEKIEGPICVIRNKKTGMSLPLSPEKSQYNVIITDGFAHIRLTQMYVNHFEEVEDIAYVYPLPHEGSVHAMSMEYRDSLYIAKIYEKEEAKQKYDKARAAGAVAALLLQNKPNVFQQRLANIGFKDTAYIRTELSTPLKYNNGIFELAVPTMVAARFGGSVGTGVSQKNPWNPPENVNGQRLQFNVMMHTGYQVIDLHSPTHDMKFTDLEISRKTLENRGALEPDETLPNGFNYSGLLMNADTYPNRDFILRFKRFKPGQDFSVATFMDTQKKNGFFALSLYPDPDLQTGGRPDLELVILIDVSGSQRGWPLAKEKEIVNIILSNLNPRDRFTLASFAGSVNWGFGENQLVSASEENISRGRNFLNNMRSAGGTYLLNAVNSVLATPKHTEHERLFVFLTDGFIGNEEAIFQTIDKHPSNPTVITFGCGNNLNRYFMDESAKIANGFSTIITQYDNLESMVQQAWEKIESPQLKNISISFNNAQVSNLVAPMNTNLFKGSPYCIFGRYENGGTFSIELTGFLQGNPVTLKRDITFDKLENINKMLPQIWARKKIAELKHEEGTGNKNKDEIIKLSKEYQVLSNYTAFLAIHPQPVMEGASYGNSQFFRAVDIQNILNLQTGLRVRIREGFLWIQVPYGHNLQSIRIYDLRGKLLFSWNRGSTSETEALFKWDGRLLTGARLKPGRYLAQVRTDRAAATHQFTWPN